jgi:hypothetical protein
MNKLPTKIKQNFIKYRNLTPKELEVYRVDKINKDIHFFESVIPSLRIFVGLSAGLFIAYYYLKNNYNKEIGRKIYLHILDLEEYDDKNNKK